MRSRQFLSLLLAIVVAIISSDAGSTPSAMDTTLRVWNFRAFLDDNEIGYHHFTLSQQGEDRVLNSEAHFKIKLWFINAYHYSHHATEHWHGDCLTNLSSNTDDNGKLFAVNTLRSGDMLDISQGAIHYVTSGCLMTFAYWNPAMLSQVKLLNAQTGEDSPVMISELPQQIITVKGQPCDAKRYTLRGKGIDITLWYSMNNDWLALESKTPTGHKLSYRLE